MSYYNNVYLKRLNRYGTDYKSRIQGQREQLFEGLLSKSSYRVDFLFEDQLEPGLLERYKQNDTKTMCYLLTRISLEIPSGTILMIPDKDGEEHPWMIYYLEEIEASGYNRYIVLRMSWHISWIARDENEYSSWAYIYRERINQLMDTMKSSRGDVLYKEDINACFLILPINSHLKKGDYFEIGEGDFKEAYMVTGFDRQSIHGVQHCTVEPTPLRDHTPAPVKQPEDKSEDFYWLDGGK